MIDLVPLVLLWALGNNKQRCPAVQPVWPTPGAPPPPPPLPLPPSAASITDAAPSGDDLASKVRAEAERVVRKNLGLPKAKPKAKPKPTKTTPAFLDYSPEMDVSVADVQKVLIKRGYKSIKKDGLYGTKTELAWGALARGRKLPPTITRLSPTIARVATNTFNTLNGPVIP